MYRLYESFVNGRESKGDFAAVVWVSLHLELEAAEAKYLPLSPQTEFVKVLTRVNAKQAYREASTLVLKGLGIIE